MSEPYWSPELDKFSECCGAISSYEIISAMENDVLVMMGLCADCGEWSEYYKEEEQNEI
tara:strand:+ start:471 stop:647 length:177 start_codon:yes stop_codon:yes gene_type:complete